MCKHLHSFDCLLTEKLIITGIMLTRFVIHWKITVKAANCMSEIFNILSIMQWIYKNWCYLCTVQCEWNTIISNNFVLHTHLLVTTYIWYTLYYGQFPWVMRTIKSRWTDWDIKMLKKILFFLLENSVRW